MKIEIRFSGLTPSAAVRDHALRRARWHLSRFGEAVSAVLVRVSDVNGPRGGIDKRCQVTVRSPRLGTATIEDLSGDAYTAIEAAFERIGRRLRRAIQRTRRGRRDLVRLPAS